MAVTFNVPIAVSRVINRPTGNEPLYRWSYFSQGAGDASGGNITFNLYVPDLGGDTYLVLDGWVLSGPAVTSTWEVTTGNLEQGLTSNAILGVKILTAADSYYIKHGSDPIYLGKATGTYQSSSGSFLALVVANVAANTYVNMWGRIYGGVPGML